VDSDLVDAMEVTPTPDHASTSGPTTTGAPAPVGLTPRPSRSAPRRTALTDSHALADSHATPRRAGRCPERCGARAAVANATR